MKRFTETTKWQDAWFMQLEPRFKLAWLYILDTCDNAGVWECNPMLLSFMVGETITQQDLEEVFEGRFITVNGSKWWIHKFVQHQYGKVLNPASKPHQSVINRLESLSIDYAKGSLTLKDKDKDKDKDKVEYKKILDLYHEALPALPSVKVLTQARKELIRERYNQFKDHEKGPIWPFEVLFHKASQSEFLIKKWGKCNFDWLMKQANFVKVIEGTYDDK